MNIPKAADLAQAAADMTALGMTDPVAIEAFLRTRFGQDFEFDFVNEDDCTSTAPSSYQAEHSIVQCGLDAGHRGMHKHWFDDGMKERWEADDAELNPGFLS